LRPTRAEEIFGKLLEKEGRKHSVEEFVESCVTIGKHIFNEDWDKKLFVEMQTFFRNGLKHITDGEPMTVPREAAEKIIDRAISNLRALEGSESTAIRRYMKLRGW